MPKTGGTQVIRYDCEGRSQEVPIWEASLSAVLGFWASQHRFEKLPSDFGGSICSFQCQIEV